MAVDIVFEDPLTTVSKLLEKLKSAWDDIVNDVNHVLSFLPGFLTEPITSVFEMCSSKVTEVFNEIAKLFSERGSEPALRTVGESWNEQVGHRASTQAGLLTKGRWRSTTGGPVTRRSAMRRRSPRRAGHSPRSRRLPIPCRPR